MVPKIVAIGRENTDPQYRFLGKAWEVREYWRVRTGPPLQSHELRDAIS